MIFVLFLLKAEWFAIVPLISVIVIMLLMLKIVYLSTDSRQ